MKSRSVSTAVGTAVFALVFSLSTHHAAGQAPNAYKAPRTADGQPDLSGVWRAWNLAQFDVEDHSAMPGIPPGRGVIVDPPDGKIPYKPEMLAKRKENYEKSRTSDPWKSADPLAKCYVPGVPRATYIGFPFEIVQMKTNVLFIYEWMHLRRPAYYDAKGRMKDIDFWFGDSRAHWDGDTLVVDVADNNDRTWFDSVGNFHSEQLHVVERYTRTGPDTLHYEATIEDPKTFTRPWKMAMDLQRQKDVGLLDYECTDLLEQQGIHITWERE